MKSKILGLLAVGLLAGSMPARAAMITELFQVTLSSAAGVYAAGHVFDITVTYDDAGTVMHEWNDGLDGIADFGDNDDTLRTTFDLADPTYTGFTLFSDAQISISGLAALPASSTARDANTFNYALYYEYLDPATNGYYLVRFRADDLYFYFHQAGPASGVSNSIFIWQYYSTASGAAGTQESIARDLSFISRTTVPEPGTLALLGLGLAGLGLSRRRKAA